MKGYGEYPDDWPQIAFYVKATWGWACERCGHPHEPATGYCLTVHHLVPDKALVALWNLAALCQRCHLSVQGRVDMFQRLLPGAPISEWFVPHLDGFHEWQKQHGKILGQRTAGDNFEECFAEGEIMFSWVDIAVMVVGTSIRDHWPIWILVTVSIVVSAYVIVAR